MYRTLLEKVCDSKTANAACGANDANLLFATSADTKEGLQV
jgi:hypothetical protein